MGAYPFFVDMGSWSYILEPRVSLADILIYFIVYLISTTNVRYDPPAVQRQIYILYYRSHPIMSHAHTHRLNNYRNGPIKNAAGPISVIRVVLGAHEKSPLRGLRDRIVSSHSERRQHKPRCQAPIAHSIVSPLPHLEL